MSQRTGLEDSLECYIFCGTEKLCVELVDIELNAGLFTVLISFIVILMCTLSFLKIPMGLGG